MAFSETPGFTAKHSNCIYYFARIIFVNILSVHNTAGHTVTHCGGLIASHMYYFMLLLLLLGLIKYLNWLVLLLLLMMLL